MRTRRFITAGAATAATLMLLAASPNPTNASPSLAEDTTNNPGITALSDAVIASVQSRAQQNPTAEQGNALELRNPTDSPVSLEDSTVRVYNSANAETANFAFNPTDSIPANGSVLLRDPDFWPPPGPSPTPRSTS